ncbi:hypothetical protein ACMFMF_006622 [Clarireedia jacksonii]
MNNITHSPTHSLQLLILINPIILSLRLQHLLLHLRNLPLPLLLSHLALPPKQLLIWLSIAAPQAIPKSRVLSVVIVEVQMMHGMARGAVENWAIGYILTVVDEDGPDLYEGEEAQVGEFLKGEDEGEDVVGERLQEAVDGVECDGGVGSGHNPFVVRLMEGLVDERMVQPPVDEVDPKIGEDEEEWELKVVVPGAGAFGGAIVEFGEAAHFGEEEGGGEDGHYWHAVDGLGDLHTDLVFEEFGVFEGGFVEDEDVREGGDEEVDGCTGDPGVEC